MIRPHKNLSISFVERLTRRGLRESLVSCVVSAFRDGRIRECEGKGKYCRGYD
jgi:hypothetical protein